MQSALKNAYQWVPSLFFMEGLPFALVSIVSVVLYKNLGIDNTQITFYAGLFTLPWALKPALAPLLEILHAKRQLILLTQFCIAMVLLVLAGCLHLTDFFAWSLLLFFLLAIFAAIHDINADGAYITHLDTKNQAYFVGIRSCCYQLGKLIGQGALIALVGFLSVHLNKINTWQVVLTLLALLILGIVLYHFYSLPRENQPFKQENASLLTAGITSFKNVWQELRRLPHLNTILIFTLTYNIPDAQLTKIVPLFLLDNPQHGGLGLSTADVGIFFGTLGILAMLVGITLSGVLLARFSLKKCLFPITLFYGLVNVGYLVLSFFKGSQHLELLAAIIILAEFGFGLSNGAYVLYLLNVFTKGAFPMSMYTIATALMMLGISLSGAISGYLQSLLGYNGFFLWIILVNFGLMIMAFYNLKLIKN